MKANPGESFQVESEYAEAQNATMNQQDDQNHPGEDLEDDPSRI